MRTIEKTKEVRMSPMAAYTDPNTTAWSAIGLDTAAMPVGVRMVSSSDARLAMGMAATRHTVTTPTRRAVRVARDMRIG